MVAQHDSVETNMELEEIQALALQMAYDNIQIVLHRQAVFVSRPSQASDSDLQNDASIEQLVESALRTANAPDHQAIFSMCRSTHAAMHVGICLFTAGVVLSGLHLGHGAVRQSNELLVALDRIISFFRIFPGEAYSLVPQCLHILETLQLRCGEILRSDRPSSQGVGSDETRTGKYRLQFSTRRNLTLLTTSVLQSLRALFWSLLLGPTITFLTLRTPKNSMRRACLTMPQAFL